MATKRAEPTRSDETTPADLRESRTAVTDVRAPAAPSFGMCEGIRAELELVEKTVDPFTGKTVTRDGE